jgi:hypothetical protein
MPKSHNQKKVQKYEFYVFEGNSTMVNTHVKAMQENGWELAGEISTKFSDNGGNRMLIPLKRKI